MSPRHQDHGESRRDFMARCAQPLTSEALAIIVRDEFAEAFAEGERARMNTPATYGPFRMRDSGRWAHTAESLDDKIALERALSQHKLGGAHDEDDDRES